jgi:hypothetical protein
VARHDYKEYGGQGGDPHVLQDELGKLVNPFGYRLKWGLNMDDDSDVMPIQPRKNPITKCAEISRKNVPLFTDIDIMIIKAMSAAEAAIWKTL